MPVDEELGVGVGAVAEEEAALEDGEDLVAELVDFYTYETDGNFSIENECSKLIALVKRCMEKDSVFKVLSDPHKVYDFVGNLKKKYGVEF
ncbi:putative glutathione S-transferase parA [Cinnamomum micranthum f. kanehirae]|uniref:Putative glutathione S-transferase parA n=1 Tax=Cinnamomum micranthum f. kanehirae TaxID=337451 RepID=A0A3S3P929_9MAGN|nr:putative glutathione S-transferase parA [Cinnamomum micranthum f. kanehirae]